MISLRCLLLGPALLAIGMSAPVTIAQAPRSPATEVRTDPKAADGSPASGAAVASDAAIGSEIGSATQACIIVVGAEGENQYRAMFHQTAELWSQIAQRNSWLASTIGLESEGESTDREQLQKRIEKYAQQSNLQRLWIVLIGHGTSAGKVSKFNLRGPDIAATDLANWVNPLSQQCVIVNCASASGPFLPALSGPNRIVVTATKSGAEINFARFGMYLAQSIADATSDLDHDQEVSLLEAFLAACSQTTRFYKDDARLVTEHALMDDNADKTGTSADFYRGLRPTKSAAAGKEIDGRLAGRIILSSSPGALKLNEEQSAQRAIIETQIDELRAQKNTMSKDAYRDALETLCVALAKLYDSAENPKPEPQDSQLR